MGVLNSPRPEVAVTRAAPEPLGPRREDKFLATADQAVAFADWAAGRFEPDPHTGPDGSYLVVSLYFDTAAFDSFRRGGDGGWPKHRLRSYGSDPELRFLEEKLRRGDRVWKRRVRCAPGDWPDGAPAGDEPGQLWFRRRWQRLGLRPVLHVTYRRVAFVSADGDRVTIDSDLACCAAAPQGAVSLAAPGPTRAGGRRS